ncbi:hypothetical protein [Natronospira bacteriovora]|uniref:Lipoprotein n=1 Tax=Natronospira bacteriovora TaxID=3069753 RepID=A0ABU0W9C5_9GAMM|nr:hypothetical protein [Natronospira sp. AB-CW4]MDQ2070646.1 hypothetical protein [Natronospira sp. AB-CW4]
MRMPYRTLFLLSGLFLLAGCAATPDREQIERELQSVYNPFDMEYVSVVNQQARRAGATVIWVNPPRKSDRDPRQD